MSEQNRIDFGFSRD